MDATTILHQRWTMDITIADEEVLIFCSEIYRDHDCHPFSGEF